jgi:hypothetical protein
MQNTKTDQLSIRIDPDIRAQLEAAADADRRPVSNLVRNVLAVPMAMSVLFRRLDQNNLGTCYNEAISPNKRPCHWRQGLVFH